MVAHSDLTETALGMSLGYFLTDIAVIICHFPDMVLTPAFVTWCHGAFVSVSSGDVINRCMH